ncbi:MAG TPA: hypothetical protein VLW17_05935 [Thermoanaerobaculaceae bacterium]|nr:hypothetical protein [Thermoanaerobaculaceae bacterium]
MMARGQTLALIGCIVLLAECVWAQDVTPAPCPAQQLCPLIAAQFTTCAKERGQAACAAFVASFRKLAGTYDCKRPFDTAPVPAAWLCEQADPKRDILFQYIDLLRSLHTLEASVFFASAEFRGMLDGHLAEIYLKESLDQQKRLAQPMGK